MKTIKQLLEEYDVLTNKVTNENKKLVELVREGLLEEEKLPLIERALAIDPELTTIAERNAINELLESLATFFILEKKDQKEENSLDRLAKKLTNLGKNEDDPNHPTNRQAPALLMFQRKAIRVYPDNMKVVVYYSPYLDKYISIPFGGKTLTVTTNINEENNTDYVDVGKRQAINIARRIKPLSSKMQASSHFNSDNSYVQKAGNREDQTVQKQLGRRAMELNRKAREQEKPDAIRRNVLDRIGHTAKGAAAAGGGAEYIANKINDTHQRLGATPALARGAIAAGQIAYHKIKNRIGDKIERRQRINNIAKKAMNSNQIQEAIVRLRAVKKSSGKNPFKSKFDFKPKAQKKKKLSWSQILGSEKKEKKEAPKKESSKKEATKSSATPKKEDLSELIAKYRKAHHDHARSSGTKVSVFSTEKGKHVELDMKKELGNHKERLAQKIRSAGGEVPHIDDPKPVKRSSNLKPPPAMAESVWSTAKKALGLGGNASPASAVPQKNPETPQSDEFTDRGPTKKGLSNIKNKNVSVSKRVTASDAALANRTAQAGIPKKGSSRSMSTVSAMAESHLKTIQKLIEENGDSVNLSFGEHTISINNRIGKKLLKIYESLNKENRQKVETMLNESADSARKVINFVVRN